MTSNKIVDNRYFSRCKAGPGTWDEIGCKKRSWAAKRGDWPRKEEIGCEEKKLAVKRGDERGCEEKKLAVKRKNRQRKEELGCEKRRSRECRAFFSIEQ